MDHIGVTACEKQIWDEDDCLSISKSLTKINWLPKNSKIVVKMGSNRLSKILSSLYIQLGIQPTPLAFFTKQVRHAIQFTWSRAPSPRRRKSKLTASFAPLFLPFAMDRSFRFDPDGSDDEADAS